MPRIDRRLVVACAAGAAVGLGCLAVGFALGRLSCPTPRQAARPSEEPARVSSVTAAPVAANQNEDLYNLRLFLKGTRMQWRRQRESAPRDVLDELDARWTAESPDGKTLINVRYPPRVEAVGLAFDLKSPNEDAIDNVVLGLEPDWVGVTDKIKRALADRRHEAASFETTRLRIRVSSAGDSGFVEFIPK
jgi:hypothetical protein